MTSLGKRVMAGALITACGAYVWAFLIFGWWGWSESHGAEKVLGLFFIPAYALLITSWFVLPMGGIIGAFMPSVVRSCTSRQAFIRGFILGICASLVAALLTMVLLEWPFISGHATKVDPYWWPDVSRQFLLYLLTMAPICGLWVGVWALRWSKRVWPNQSPEPTAVGASVASHAANRRWLSFFR
jgi:hypothetical protein